jgi:uncharacterized membrane protein
MFLRNQMFNNFVNKIFAGLFLVYPLIIYLGVKHLETVTASIIISIVLVGRMILMKNQKEWPLGKAIYFALGMTLVNNLMNLYFKSELSLKIYPVLMSFVVFIVFVRSLIVGPPIIEQFARQFEKDLSDDKLLYIKKLTIIWSIWLFVNTCLAIVTAVWANAEVWLIYNNLVFYLISGTLVVLDIGYRKLIFNKREIRRINKIV